VGCAHSRSLGREKSKAMSFCSLFIVLILK
jgi:hypothetical protein